MPNSSPTANGKSPPSAMPATVTEANCFPAIRGLNSKRGAGCSEETVGDAASRLSTEVVLRSRLFLDLFLDLGPGVFQRHSAVKHRTPRLGIRVDAKIPKSFKLIAARDGRICQRWLQLGLRDHFQRVRIQVRCELLAFFNLIRVFLSEELVVDTHFAVDNVPGLAPLDD